MSKLIVRKDARDYMHEPINTKPVNVDSIEAMTPETDKKVYGQFVNVECPGQTARIGCRYYRGMTIFNETLHDGERYTIPLSVARHINERCQVMRHKNSTDENGNPIKGETYIPRYKFIIEKYVT